MNNEKIYQRLKSVSRFITKDINMLTGPCEECNCGLKEMSLTEYDTNAIADLLVEKSEKCKESQQKTINHFLNNPNLLAIIDHLNSQQELKNKAENKNEASKTSLSTS